MEPWRRKSMAAAFPPFPATTKYFRSATQQWMISFRVAR
jgi:hypothetical protein